MEKKFTPLLVIGIFIALLFAILVFVKLNKKDANLDSPVYNEVSPSADLAIDFTSKPIYIFSSVDCPHCQNVVNYLDGQPTLIDQFGITKVSLDNVATKSLHQKNLTAFATICELDTRTVGIPFLYLNDENIAAKERCLIGDGPIIDYFKAETSN